MLTSANNIFDAKQISEISWEAEYMPLICIWKVVLWYNLEVDISAERK